MTQVSSILKNNNLNAEIDLGYREKEEIIETLVEQGLPRVFNPLNYINRIAQDFGISVNDAKECLKEAVQRLEDAAEEEEQPEEEEKLYAQSEYFYPSQNKNSLKRKDGMDSLTAYATFQRLKFGL